METVSPGTGKTHLALVLGYQACLQGMKTLFTTAMNLINQLSTSLADHSFLKAVKTFTSTRLLIIDELGYVGANWCSGRGKTLDGPR